MRGLRSEMRERDEKERESREGQRERWSKERERVGIKNNNNK